MRLRGWIHTFDDLIPEALCAEAREHVDKVGVRFDGDGGYRKCTEISVSSGSIFDGAKAVLRAAFDQYKQAQNNGNLAFITHLEPPTIIRYDVGKDRFAMHADTWNPESALRQMSFVLYLNDVEYGGETAFPSFGVSVKPKKGRVLLFPPFFMYPHMSTTPISEPKYAIVGWLCFPAGATSGHYTVTPL
jgi:hypothetical protein